MTAAGLARLSGMAPEEVAQFQSEWRRIDATRRLAVVQELTDLEEDNVEFDFDAVFLEGIKDENLEVRLASVRGLWEYEGPDVIAPLVNLTEEDPRPGRARGVCVGARTICDAARDGSTPGSSFHRR